MCLRFVFLLTTRAASWLRLSRREETWKTAEIPGRRELIPAAIFAAEDLPAGTEIAVGRRMPTAPQPRSCWTMATGCTYFPRHTGSSWNFNVLAADSAR